MEKIVYHKLPRQISAKGFKQLENLKKMSDEDIDYSDAPPLNKRQLDEVAYIVKERDKCFGSTMRLTCPPFATPSLRM
jgi:hypothetical protein